MGEEIRVSKKSLKFIGLFVFLIIVVLSVIAVKSQSSENIIVTHLHEDIYFTFNEKGLTKMEMPGEGNRIVFLGNAVTGRIGSQRRVLKVDDTNWIWTKTHYQVIDREYTNIEAGEYYNETWDIYNITGISDGSNLLWTQQWVFHPKQQIKKTDVITNNLPTAVTDARFWYIFTIPSDFSLRYAGREYIVSRDGNVHLEGQELRVYNPLLKMQALEFGYADLIADGFDITDFYIGNGSIVGYPQYYIAAVAVTKNGGNFPAGATVILDPQVSSYHSPASASGTFTLSGNVISSNNLRATAATNGHNLTALNFSFEDLPDDATITGIEVSIEAGVREAGCVIE